MEKNIFFDMTEELFRLNSLLQKKVLCEEEIKEEIENYSNFIHAQEELQKLLLNIYTCPLNNLDEFSKNVVHFHLRISNLSWYFWNMSENLEKLIKAGFEQSVLDTQQIKNITSCFFEESKKQDVHNSLNQ